MCHANIKNIELCKSVKTFWLRLCSIFLKKCQKIDFWRARGECPKSQKKWSKTHFFPSVQKKNRTNSGQKVVFPGGRAGPSKWPLEAVFSQLCCGFYKKQSAGTILLTITSIIELYKIFLYMRKQQVHSTISFDV